MVRRHIGFLPDPTPPDTLAEALLAARIRPSRILYGIVVDFDTMITRRVIIQQIDASQEEDEPEVTKKIHKIGF